MKTSYPLIFTKDEIQRLDSQSINLSDELICELGAMSVSIYLK